MEFFKREYGKASRCKSRQILVVHQREAGFAVNKGKGIARLDSNFMKCLGLSPGDIIEIQGLRKTYSKCFAGPENKPHIWNSQHGQVDLQ